jgi:hypothetical protein
MRNHPQNGSFVDYWITLPEGPENVDFQGLSCAFYGPPISWIRYSTAQVAQGALSLLSPLALRVRLHQVLHLCQQRPIRGAIVSKLPRHLRRGLIFGHATQHLKLIGGHLAKRH